MPLTLNTTAEKRIRDHMKMGGYATVDDVVLAALAALDQQKKPFEFEVGEMDDLLAEGEASGVPLDGNEVLQELRQLRSKR